MTVSADALDLLAGDPPRYPHVPGDFHRHPETGAPYVNHPTETRKDGTPKRVMYGRPSSSFGSALDNPFNLLKWKERQLLIGAAKLEAELARDDVDPYWLLLDIEKEERNALDALAARCHAAAGSHLAADQGTHIHRLTEQLDKLGTPGEMVDLWREGEALGIPADLQRQIVDQWIDFRNRNGLTALAVEQTVVNDRWRLAGTLDRLDVADRDILTAYGVLEAGQPFVGDIKTGSLTVGNDGQPNYWVKYPVQLAAYVDAVPYDTETDERGEWTNADSDYPPNPHIALIYHYDLARALAGEVVDWQIIPVNVDAGREGGDLCRQAADFAKRRDLFAMPAPIAAPGLVAPVEQPAAQPATSSDSAANVWDRESLRDRIQGLLIHQPEAEWRLRQEWPPGVPTLRHDGHTYEQLGYILDAIRKVEAEVGAPFVPGDVTSRSGAIRRALKAWEGRDPGTAWFAASLIATFEQCRNADATLEELVAQFTIEQADRLYDAAQAATQTK